MKNDLIVVGGGIAGLTAALAVAKKGHKVTLIEKNEHCGGLMSSFTRAGFHFEGGARALVNAGLIKPLIKEFNIDLEILPNPITLVIADKTLRITGESSIHEYSRILKELYPESTEDVDRIIRSIQKAVDDMKVLYGADNPLFSKKLKLIPLIGWFLKFIRTMYRIKKMNGPFEKEMDKLSANKSLKNIIGQHFFKGTPAFFALSYFALYNDYLYPKGGVGKFTEKLSKKITEKGGKIINNTEIKKVIAHSHTLIDDKGNEYEYEKLIWAADLKDLYKMTDLQKIPGNKLHKINKEKEKILSAKGAESVFSVYLAVNESPKAMENISTGHLFYTPEKNGLGEIHGSELQEMLKEKLSRERLYGWLERFFKYNTYEISIPVLRDPDAAPHGKTGIIISFLFDHGLTKKISENGWYDEFKKKVEDSIIALFSETIYPGIRKKIIFSFSASPLTIENRVNSSEGSIVGWSFEKELPVGSNMLRIKESVRTAIPDVFKAGKWVYSPAGGPTAIMTGRLAANECTKK